MGRLIDADALIEAMKKTEEEYEDAMTCPSWWSAYNVIKEQPTSYDVEKVVAELEEYATSQICYRYTNCPYIHDENIKCENCGAMGAIDIVRKGGVE